MVVSRSGRLLAGVAIAIISGFATTPTLASTVALSVNEITGFALGFSGSSTFSGFTFSNSTAADESGGTGGSALLDAPASCVGSCGGWNNQFYAHSPGTEFSYGDALILNPNVAGGSGAASSIGEALVTDGLAHASGSNVMTSVFSVSEGTVISFAFDADPHLTTQLGAGGTSAAANIFFNITVTDNTGTVFSWSPDGATGGITGGTETQDPFSLNLGIGGDTTYNPANAAFAAQTAALHSGIAYTLNIKMENQVNGSSTVVPVPAAIWLFGSGLLGLAGIARRRS